MTQCLFQLGKVDAAVVQINPLILGQGNHQPFSARIEVASSPFLGEVDIDTLLEHGSSDHENNEQHQHHIHEGGDVDPRDRRRDLAGIVNGQRNQVDAERRRGGLRGANQPAMRRDAAPE